MRILVKKNIRQNATPFLWESGGGGGKRKKMIKQQKKKKKVVAKQRKNSYNNSWDFVPTKVIHLKEDFYHGS